MDMSEPWRRWTCISHAVGIVIRSSVVVMVGSSVVSLRVFKSDGKQDPRSQKEKKKCD